jgi:hypothetical protein
VGASGSGKSSLVAAGLLPRLAAGALPGSQDWLCPRFTPAEVGDNPFMVLALACRDALPAHGPEPREWAERLAAEPGALAEWRDRLLDARPVWAKVLFFAGGLDGDPRPRQNAPLILMWPRGRAGG